MPNLMGGDKYKRTKTKRKQDRNRECTIDPTDGLHFYGLIDKNLGGTCPRFIVKLHDGTTMQTLSPGRMKKKVWINIGDYVIVCKNNTSCEIVCKINSEYQKREADKYLRKFDDNIPEITFGEKINKLGIHLEGASDDETNPFENKQTENSPKREEKSNGKNSEENEENEDEPLDIENI